MAEQGEAARLGLDAYVKTAPLINELLDNHRISGDQEALEVLKLWVTSLRAKIDFEKIQK
jgi:hypothetical protein